MSFDTSTFFIQVHGLPPAMLHKENAIKIGNQLGLLHMDSIHNKTMVSHRYLHFRVDLKVDDPIPAGYFLDRPSGEELWVQFKIERLLDFCYRCGLLQHVTGRCGFSTPATIITSSRIKAQLYGPWIRAERPESL